MRISDCWLLFDSFSLTLDFVSDIDGATGSNELFTFFMNMMITLIFLVGIDHGIYVDETFELLKIV